MEETLYVRDAIQFCVADLQQNLADYVRQIVHEKNLSYRQIAFQSRNLISHATVSDIISGKNANPSPKIIQGLARGLGVSEDELFDIARGKKRFEADHKPQNIAEFFEALDSIGIDAFMGFEGRDGLEDLTPDDYQELLDNMKAMVEVKISRRKRENAK